MIYLIRLGGHGLPSFPHFQHPIGYCKPDSLDEKNGVGDPPNSDLLKGDFLQILPLVNHKDEIAVWDIYVFPIFPRNLNVQKSKLTSSKKNEFTSHTEREHAFRQFCRDIFYGKTP